MGDLLRSESEGNYRGTTLELIINSKVIKVLKRRRKGVGREG